MRPDATLPRLESPPRGPVSAKITIDASRERVFDLLCDLAGRPAFTDHFLTDFRLARVDPVGPGASARFRVGDLDVWFDTVIERAERPYLVREHGRAAGAPTGSDGDLGAGRAASGCELTLTFGIRAGEPDRPCP